MGKYFVKRLGMAILTIFLVACLTFLLMNAVPGSPWLSEKTPSETTLAALNAKYGLDKPVYVQLYMYLKNILHGDFGVSLKMQKNRAVLSIITEMFPVSAKVGAIAFVLGSAGRYTSLAVLLLLNEANSQIVCFALFVLSASLCPALL